MIAREQLKAEIDRLDDSYLELAFKIICQFPRASDEKASRQGQQIADILQEIADSGGLGISDPVIWQRKARQDRALPFESGKTYRLPTPYNSYGAATALAEAMAVYQEGSN